MPGAVGPFPAGSGYRANDLGPLTWVQATLTETCVLVYDLILPALTETERERYYAESRQFAGLSGIPSSSLPADWRGFLAYNAQMHRSDVLTVSREARMIVQKLLFNASSWRRMPAWYSALTAGLLPGPLREGFGLRYGRAERRIAERALGCFRQIYPILPDRLRFVGPYQEARTRLAGAARPDICVRFLNRIWIGRPLQGS
jgi:uncharacterized protein (DUF2236 family)